jgi:transcriptional regulator with XRE-family HTH domain
MARALSHAAMIDPTALLQFPGWLRNAIASGLSTSQLAQLLGTSPATVARLVGSVPTRPADVRRLARKLGVDYESLRTFTDDALQPLTGFDAETQLMLRIWRKLDPKRRAAVLVVLKDMAGASGSRRRKAKKHD